MAPKLVMSDGGAAGLSGSDYGKRTEIFLATKFGFVDTTDSENVFASCEETTDGLD